MCGVGVGDGDDDVAASVGIGFAGDVGTLNRNAASINMALLYGARLCKHEHLRPIQRLAECLHMWTPLHSRKLHRLIEYTACHLDDCQYGFIGDDWKDRRLRYFSYAELALSSIHI